MTACSRCAIPPTKCERRSRRRSGKRKKSQTMSKRCGSAATPMGRALTLALSWAGAGCRIRSLRSVRFGSQQLLLFTRTHGPYQAGCKRGPGQDERQRMCISIPAPPSHRSGFWSGKKLALPDCGSIKTAEPGSRARFLKAQSRRIERKAKLKLCRQRGVGRQAHRDLHRSARR